MKSMGYECSCFDEIDDRLLRVVSALIGIISRPCFSEGTKISAFFGDDEVKAYDVWDLFHGYWHGA